LSSFYVDKSLFKLILFYNSFFVGFLFGAFSFLGVTFGGNGILLISINFIRKNIGDNF